MNNMKLLFKTLFRFIRTFLFIIIFLVNISFKLLNTVIQQITNRLRFSITFKITISYLFIFIFIFLLMDIGILAAFSYYIQKVDYIYSLGSILGAFNILGLILIVFIGSKINKKLLSPIEIMTKTANEISINALDKRLDISGSKDELRDLAKTFNNMMDRIQKSVEKQNQFISDASHELRTPISVIQGYANLLDRWGKNDQQILDESILAIKSEAENMKNLVENLLFLARGDKNAQKLDKQNFLLSEVIDEIIKETKLIDANHTILNEKNEEFIIQGDKKLIKEGIRIFIDNSIKYTPNGGIIQLNLYKKNNKAIICIQDTGIGISHEDLPYIFNRFYRSDKSRTKKNGGTGLGLAIAKWIIDNHNGKINVSSKLHVGTIVKVELPINN